MLEGFPEVKPGIVSPVPKKVIDSKGQPDHLIEPGKPIEKPENDAIDYSMWEAGYGRSLIDEERLEIRTRLVEFAKILMSEGLKHGGK